MKNVVPRFHRSVQNTENYSAYTQAPGRDSWKPLLDDLKPTINSALHSFANGDESFRVRATILAKQAVDSYNPDNPEGASLTTHVYNHLKRLHRYRDKRMAPVHYPESVRNDRRAVLKFKQDFEERHQREPSQSELMDSMGMSRKRINNALNVFPDVAASQMESEKGEQIAETTSTQDIRRSKRMDLVYLDQDNIGKKVMEWGMGYNRADTMPKAQIAGKLGISAPAVSQRISTILNKVEAPESYDQSSTDMLPADDSEGIDTGYIGGLGLASV